MSFGVTTTGFVTKRLADIKSEVEAALQSTFGSGIDLSSESPLGQLVGIFSERESLLWELAEGVYNSAYPDTAEGASLDNAVALTGIARQGETFSTVTPTLFGTAGTVIPQGSVASVSGDATARFALDADATIAAAIDEVQHVAFSGLPASGTWTLTFDGQTTSALAFDADAAAVQAALRALSNLSAVTVAGDYAAGFDVTFAGADGGVNQPQMTATPSSLETSAPAAVTITVTTTTAGAAAQIDAAFTAETAGPVAAPAASLTVIETPVSGWTSLTNALDAVLGDAVETDAALKLRRATSVQKAGAGTAEAIRADLLALDGVVAALVFENTTTTVDGDGRPAKSFEAIVQGGTDAAIALTIWQDKPAGIATFGDTTVAVTDSQGFSRDVNFSRPTPIDIYLELDLTVIAGTYPTDGDALVKAAVVAYGDTLGLGDDVIVFPKLIASLNDIPGITDIVVRIGTAVSPTLDDNITIGSFELATFDTSRITVAS